jgi:ribosomal protein S18 acetylase RimI-like enzyme
MVRVVRMSATDWPEVWKLLQPVFQSGETFAFSPDISEDVARDAWLTAPRATYVARNGNDVIVGTYFIRPNQPGLGSHVCNCGYVVSETSRGQGVASLMCEHSQAEARRLGFLAMQFNLVVSTNDGAVRLWEKLGFQTVGRLPDAFRHRTRGFVDAFVMFKSL